MDQANAAKNDREMLDSIAELLELETSLFQYLSTQSLNMTSEQESATMEKINKLTIMRNSLYEKLTKSLTSADNTSQAEIRELNTKYGAMWAQEKQLSDDKRLFLDSQSDRENKLRLIEINQYYYAQMTERKQFFQELTAFFLQIMLCIGLMLYFRLPVTWMYVVLLVLCTLFLPRLWTRYQSIESRDNMDYQKYMWYFKLPDVSAADRGASSAELSAMLMYGKNSCLDDACCAAGTSFDSTLQQCVAASSTASTTTTTTTATTTAAA